MKKTITKILVILMAIMPAITMAHPGHGHENPLSPDHYLGNPAHAIPIVLTLSAVAGLAFWVRKKVASKK